MSYRLIKSQYGGGSFEILLLIAVVAVAWYVFVQSNPPKKPVVKAKEPFTTSESVASDIANSRDRPAVDLKSPGVPYLPYPKHLGFSEQSSVSGRMVSSSVTPKSIISASSVRPRKVHKKRVIRKVVRVSPKSVVSTPKTVSPKSVVSTPKTTPKTVSPKSVVSTPKSVASTPKSVVKARKAVRKVRKAVRSVSPKSAVSTPKSVASTPKSSPKGLTPKAVKATVGAKLTKVTQKVERFTDVNKLSSVQDAYDLKTPLQKSVCSQKCCGYYWKENMEGMFKKDDPVKWEDVGVGRKYRTSNVTCMGDGVAPPGCRCYTGDQFELLATRGGNSSKMY